MVGNVTVVFDYGAAVDDAICPDNTVCVNDGVGHDHSPRAGCCGRGHCRSGVDEGSWFKPNCTGCLKALRARSIAADGNDKMRVARGSQAGEFSPGARNAATLKFPRQLRRGVIDENDTRETALCSSDIKHDFAVPTGAPNDEIHVITR
jgi:hypothetical protein